MTVSWIRFHLLCLAESRGIWNSAKYIKSLEAVLAVCTKNWYYTQLLHIIKIFIFLRYSSISCQFWSFLNSRDIISLVNLTGSLIFNCFIQFVRHFPQNKSDWWFIGYRLIVEALTRLFYWFILYLKFKFQTIVINILIMRTNYI